MAAIRIEHDTGFYTRHMFSHSIAFHRYEQERMKKTTTKNPTRNGDKEINRFDCLTAIFYICLLIAIKNWMIIHANFYRH